MHDLFVVIPVTGCCWVIRTAAMRDLKIMHSVICMIITY